MSINIVQYYTELSSDASFSQLISFLPLQLFKQCVHSHLTRHATRVDSTFDAIGRYHHKVNGLFCTRLFPKRLDTIAKFATFVFCYSIFGS